MFNSSFLNFGNSQPNFTMSDILEQARNNPNLSAMDRWTLAQNLDANRDTFYSGDAGQSPSIGTANAEGGGFGDTMGGVSAGFQGIAALWNAWNAMQSGKRMDEYLDMNKDALDFNRKAGVHDYNRKLEDKHKMAQQYAGKPIDNNYLGRWKLTA